MKKSIYFVILSFLLFGCQKNAYTIVVRLINDKINERNARIYYDQTFISSETKIESINEVKYVRINVPDSVKIPVDSKFISGYVDFLGSRGVRIIPGVSLNYFTNRDTVFGISSEDIIIKLKKTDPQLINEILDKMKQLTKQRERDSIARDSLSQQ